APVAETRVRQRSEPCDTEVGRQSEAAGQLQPREVDRRAREAREGVALVVPDEAHRLEEVRRNLGAPPEGRAQVLEVRGLGEQERGARALPHPCGRAQRLLATQD